MRGLDTVAFRGAFVFGLERNCGRLFRTGSYNVLKVLGIRHYTHRDTDRRRETARERSELKRDGLLITAAYICRAAAFELSYGFSFLDRACVAGVRFNDFSQSHDNVLLIVLPT